jgi:(p)ppGpp synthase/HD superfamily hydrolase
MIYSEQIQKAIRFSTKTHEVYQKQKRKGKDIPYITHPLIVGLILARAEASEDVIVAGILHDTMEDSVAEKKVTKEMIAERFGNRVADIVESVTEPNKDLSWEERKEEAYHHIPDMAHDSLLVKSADLISNISEIISDHNDEGVETFSRFNAPLEKIIAHYMRMIDAIGKEWPGNPLNEDLQSLKLAPVFAPPL